MNLGIWLAIMAVVLVLVLALWIALVMRAGRSQQGRVQATSPQREMTGGTFVAREGGRQVMPDPHASAPDPARSDAEQGRGAK